MVEIVRPIVTIGLLDNDEFSLAFLERAISELGGELNTSAEDGDWVIYARIPARRDSIAGRPS